jgi:ACS family hexuronate transporter-like MFS transporter
MGGFFLNMGAGRIRDMFGSYVIVFAIAGSAYLVALLVIHLLVPKLEPARPDRRRSRVRGEAGVVADRIIKS